MQRNIALKFDCPNLKCSCWNEDGAAAVACAGINGRLKGGCVECDAVALGAEVANVVDAGS